MAANILARHRAIIAAILVSLLTACGGGGGDSDAQIRSDLRNSQPVNCTGNPKACG